MSRKLAGEPPNNLITSIDVIANPAPLTMQTDIAVELDEIDAVLACFAF